MLIGSKGTTFPETVFTTVLLFNTVGLFAYLISTMGIIIEELNKQTQEYKNDLKIINYYMRQKRLSKEICGLNRYP